jgi:hypothetical protein
VASEKDASTWCVGLDHSDVRLETECMHGVGHGIAITTRSCLAESLRQCATLKNSWIEPGANGAMTEHIARERRDVLFFKTADNGESAAGTPTRRTLTTGEVEMPCSEAPGATRIPCYHLV